MNGKRELMVVVHPGSACGSADFNLGPRDGPIARDALATEIGEWEGDAAILDSDLSDEIHAYPRLDIALDELEERAEQRGLFLHRMTACDITVEQWPDHAAMEIVRLWEPTEEDRILITGAWTDPDEGGCVNALAKALRRVTNARIEVSSRALHLP